MKKFLQIIFFVIFTIALYFTISRASPNNYNIAVYAIFVALLSYLLFLELSQVYKARKSTICNGVIIDVVKIDETDNPDYSLEIKFISPADNIEYVIKAKTPALPTGKFVDVIFNDENPSNSTLYFKPTPHRLILYILSILFFSYKLLASLYNN